MLTAGRRPATPRAPWTSPARAAARLARAARERRARRLDRALHERRLLAVQARERRRGQARRARRPLRRDRRSRGVGRGEGPRGAVRGRARTGRRRPREGNRQRRRQLPPSSPPQARGVAAQGSGEGGPSRRAFLAGGRRRRGGAAGARGLARPGDADAYHFCGHIYTTDGCPHPTGLPRIDRRGFPLRARDGRRVDDLGRVIDGAGRPLGEEGMALTDPDGRALPVAPRSPVCRPPARFRIRVGPTAPGTLLPRPGAQARRLLLARQSASTATLAEGLLLRRSEGLLRHVLPVLGPMLNPW